MAPTTARERTMTNEIAGKCVLVTGGGRGIGRATSLLCAARGWAVAVNYTHDAAAAEKVVAAIEAEGGRALAVHANVANDAQVQAMFETIDRAMPPLAGLVNNAGVVDFGARVDAMTPARLQRMFAINVFGSFYCAREAIRRMTTKPAPPAAPAARRRNHRQRLLGRSQARRAGTVRRLRRGQGGDRDLHPRPGEGARRRRHPRQRSPSGHHRDRDPCLGRHARPGGADAAAPADATRRHGRRGGRGDRLPPVRRGQLHQRLDPRGHRRALNAAAERGPLSVARRSPAPAECIHAPAPLPPGRRRLA